MVQQGNHLYTSGATGTNAAVVRGALKADRPELLTVVLPQSLAMQPEESRLLLKDVRFTSFRFFPFGSYGMMSDRCLTRSSHSRWQGSLRSRGNFSKMYGWPLHLFPRSLLSDRQAGCLTDF